MDQNIVIVDFSGTLVKSDVAEEANLKRFELLNIPLPSTKKHQEQHASKSHYAVIKEHISSQFGIEDQMRIAYVQNYGERIDLQGKDIKTMMMTDLFRDSMYLVAKKRGKNVYREGMIEALEEIQSKGYKLAIVSGIRSDIISGMLAITKCPVTFDMIYGQDPVLSKDNNDEQMSKLALQGNITHIIGDKLSDISPAQTLGAQSIFFKGGHRTGGEEEFADHTISSAAELNKIIR